MTCFSLLRELYRFDRDRQRAFRLRVNQALHAL